MFTKARDASVPLDTIERAVKRGTGELEGVRYEPVAYEGYAPSGVALIVECLTDNRNRTGSEIRSLFTRNGGSMAEPGAVSWLFERKGVVLVPKSVGEDELMVVALDAGGEDLSDEGDEWMLTSGPGDLGALRTALEAASIKVKSAEFEMVPSQRVEIAEEATAKRVLKMIELLEEHDDVQSVWANFDIPDEILESVEL
jgi:YebC/PmpR family DNA-binding regulatory protein